MYKRQAPTERTLQHPPETYPEHMKKLAALAALPLALTACSSGGDSASSTTSSVSSSMGGAATKSTSQSTTSSASAHTSTATEASPPPSVTSTTSQPTPASASADLMSDGSDNLLSETEKQTARAFARKAIAAFPGAFEYMAYNRVYGFGNAPCVYLETMSPAEAKAATRAPNLTDEQQSQFYDLAVSTLCPAKAK